MEKKEGSEINPAFLIPFFGSIIVIFLAVRIHAFFLTLTTYRGLNWADAEAEFIKNRFSDVPMTTAETVSLILTLSILAIFLALGIYFYNRFKEKTYSYIEQRMIRKRHLGKQGTARWGTEQTLKPLMGDDGVFLGYSEGIANKPVRLSLRASCEHIAVIGPTGCGKTSSFFIPNLLTLPEGVSAVVTDPKGELEQITGDRLRERGWKVVALAPGRKNSGVYNPLANCKDETEVSELASITLKNGYSEGGQTDQWVSFAQPLWESMLLLERELAKKENRVPSMVKAYKYISTMDEDKRKELAMQGSVKVMETYLAYGQSLQSPETAGSIRTVAVSSLKLFTRDDIAGVVQDEGFSPSDLRKEPTVFFIQIPEHKSQLMKPFSATLYWQIMEHLVMEPGLPVFFFLDEFPNIGKIPGFAQMAATLRSRKISLNVCMQGIEQLAREYSPEEQTDIINNLKTKIFYSGLTGESNEFFQKIAGRASYEEESTNLLSADELRRLEKDRIIVLAHNLPPVILKAIPYFKQNQTSAKPSIPSLSSLVKKVQKA
ncbi:MAG: type IV secretory system conjugative DNA transfer family protein [Clostridia bacterium]|nr:type IV secretory system conjugative DNA transfer family protein [Clostridia bacterium]